MQCVSIQGSGQYDHVQAKSGEFICMGLDKIYSVLRIVQEAGKIRVEEVLQSLRDGLEPVFAGGIETFIMKQDIY